VGEHDYLLRLVVVSLDRYRQIVNGMMSGPLQVTSYTSHVVHRSGSKPLDVGPARSPDSKRRLDAERGQSLGQVER
jgi:hypothetical protein